MSTERINKLNNLVRDVVAAVLQEEFIHDNSALVTVTRAVVSPTLENVTVWVSVLPDSVRKSVYKALKEQIYDLQQSVNKRLIMRPVPKIRFEIDETEEQAARIEKIIEEVDK